MTRKMPEGDKWELQDDDENSQWYNQTYLFDFSFIPYKGMKKLVKSCVWQRWQKGEKTLNALKNDMTGFKEFINFTQINQITTLATLTNADTKRYKSHLASVISSSGTPLKPFSQKGYFNSLKSIVVFGQKEQMFSEVPRNEVFSPKEFSSIGKKIVITFIPDEIVKAINIKLPLEENIYLKSGIIIMQCTGIRKGDLLKLKVDCLKKHPIDGGDVIRYFIHKTRKNKSVKIPAICAEAIKNLIEHTSELREKMPPEKRDYLFIHRGGNSHRSNTTISNKSFQTWIRDFCIKHEIKDSNGEIYNLSSHQFRRTLFTDMLSKGLSLKAISRHGGATPRTIMKYYATVKDKEMRAVFKGVNVIGNPDKIAETFISDPEERKLFKENQNKGARMCDGYCTEPIKDGQICETLKKRRRCYSCRRYITTPEFLEFHRSHLKEVEFEIENNVYGEHYASHLFPLADILREIIKQLEKVK